LLADNTEEFNEKIFKYPFHLKLPELGSLKLQKKVKMS